MCQKILVLGKIESKLSIFALNKQIMIKQNNMIGFSFRIEHFS